VGSSMADAIKVGREDCRLQGIGIIDRRFGCRGVWKQAVSPYGHLKSEAQAPIPGHSRPALGPPPCHCRCLGNQRQYGVNSITSTWECVLRTRKHTGIARRSPLTAPQRHLQEATSCLTTSLPQLDLVHLTSTGVGREIVNAGKLEARECQVFGESLAYFFLARPVYRVPAGDDKSDHIGLFPFGFVWPPENLGHPYHVFLSIPVRLTKDFIIKSFLEAISWRISRLSQPLMAHENI